MTQGAVSDQSGVEDTRKIHNSAGEESVATTRPRARRGPEKGTRYRSFGTVQKTGNRFAARYTGPDRKYHTAGMTFSSDVRAQGWLANELGLIERGEWTPPAQRRRLAEARQITFGDFARDWIDNRWNVPGLVEGGTCFAGS